MKIVNEKEQFLCTTRLINVYNNINQHQNISNKMIFECATLICFYRIFIFIIIKIENTFGLIKVNFRQEDLMEILGNYFLMKKNNLQLFLEMLYSLNISCIIIILFLFIIVNVWNSLKMILNMNNVEDKKLYDSIMARVYPHHSQQINSSYSLNQSMYMQQQQQQQPVFIPPPLQQSQQTIQPQQQQMYPPPPPPQFQPIQQDDNNYNQHQQQPIYSPPDNQQQQQMNQNPPQFNIQLQQLPMYSPAQQYPQINPQFQQLFNQQQMNQNPPQFRPPFIQ